MSESIETPTEVEPMDLPTERRRLMEGGLVESTAPSDPWVLFGDWLDHAVHLGLHNANAMAIATADASGRPSVRNVLLKGRFDGGLAFYTNYTSRKGRELDENPVAEALFSWLPLERQVRFGGRVERLSATQSDDYFASRARESRISAIASPQSSVVASRVELDELRVAAESANPGEDPARPDHWGGFLLVPDRVEFWQGRPSRYHDRLVYSPSTPPGDGPLTWTRHRLAP